MGVAAHRIVQRARVLDLWLAHLDLAAIVAHEPSRESGAPEQTHQVKRLMDAAESRCTWAEVRHFPPSPTYSHLTITIFPMSCDSMVAFRAKTKNKYTVRGQGQRTALEIETTMFEALEICGLPGMKGCLQSSQKVGLVDFRFQP